MRIMPHDRGITLKPGQKVRVVRTVSIAYDLDISEYMDGEDDLDGSPITVINLELDIEEHQDIQDVLAESDDKTDLEITDIKVEITEIL